MARNKLFRFHFLLSAAVLGSLKLVASVTAAQSATVGNRPIHIPVNMWQKNVNGVRKPRVNIGIGSLQPLPFGLDTGSTGLHVFADANLGSNDRNGVRCTNEPTHVTYGNPPRMTFSGVVCYATLRFGSYTSPKDVPLAYLTEASCTQQNSNCTPPDLHNPKEMGGYGVFGIGLTGIMFGNGNVPNPILTLPEPYSSSYSVRLSRDGGALVLGTKEPSNAVEFQLNPSQLAGATWSFAKTCLLVNGSSVGTCLPISFDTGNPTPWFHNVIASLPESPPGFVTASTRIGFSPMGSTAEAFSLTAGTTPFVNQIKVLHIPGAAQLTNVGIEAFFGRIVTYDNTRGTISFAPN